MASNAPITPQWVVNEVARQFLNRWVLGAKANRSYDTQFKVKGAKVGSIIQARLPQRYRVGSGAAINKQPVIDQVTPVQITDQTNIGIELSSYTLTLEKSDIQKNVIMPAVNALVQDVEAKGFQRLYKKVPNSIGTLGTSPTAGLTYSQGVAKLVDMAGEPDELCAILSPDQSAVIADAQKAYFSPNAAIAAAFRTGQFGGEAYGINDWYRSPNVAQHTTGSFTSMTALINQATFTEGMSSVAMDGLTAGSAALKAGDVFTVANVNEVNSANYVSTGRLRQFVLTADISADGTAYFYPPMYSASSGSQLATVDNLPVDNAAVLFWGVAAGQSLSATKSRQGLIFDPNSFVLAMADAEDVDAPVCVFARDEEAGISMRLTKSYDINSDNNLARLDMFWGWSPIRTEWRALRVQGA
jgi:hypothetical protein